jgi:signal peptidase I
MTGVIMEVEGKTMGTQGWIQAVAIGRRPKRTLLRLSVIIALGLAAFVVFRYWLRPVKIQGPSMMPTFADGSYNFVNCLAYLHHEPQRGDIVLIRFLSVAEPASKVQMTLCKRIVGLPGEEVSFVAGRLCINGRPLTEPYLKYPSADWEAPPKLLGPDEYYVVGDNRSMPYEFHEKGAFGRRRILGKFLFGGGT